MPVHRTLQNSPDDIRAEQSQRRVILVDENDRPTGETDIVDAHQGEGKLHRAITIFVFRNLTGNPADTEVLLQKRSTYKLVGALKWATTACGNVRPDENWQSCAYQRLSYEMGVASVKLEPVAKFVYQVQTDPGFSEHEMLQVYAGWGDVAVLPNSEEVAEYQWHNWDSLKSSLGQLSPSDYNSEWASWLVYILQKSEVVEKLEEFIAGQMEK